MIAGLQLPYDCLRICKQSESPIGTKASADDCSQDFGTFEIGHAHILATKFIIHLPILPLSSNIVI